MRTGTGNAVGLLVCIKEHVDAINCGSYRGIKLLDPGNQGDGKSY